MDTLISEHTVDDGNYTEDDQHQVTRMQTIAGRRNSLFKAVDKVGALILKNPTQHKRARRSSALPLPTDNTDLLIDVYVETATVDADLEQEVSRYATAYAEGSKRALRRSSWMRTLCCTESLVTKVKDFTQKFKRKRVGAL